MSHTIGSTSSSSPSEGHRAARASRAEVRRAMSTLYAERRHVFEAAPDAYLLPAVWATPAPEPLLRAQRGNTTLRVLGFMCAIGVLAWVGRLAVRELSAAPEAPARVASNQPT